MAYDPAPQIFKSLSADTNLWTTRLSNAATGTAGAIVDFGYIRAVRNRVDAIRKLGGLCNDWDGYGSIAPTTSSLAMAERLVRELPSDKRPVDQIKPDAEGGVSLIWDTNTARTIFTIDGAEIHMSREFADGTIELPAPAAYFCSSPVMPSTNVLALVPQA